MKRLRVTEIVVASMLIGSLAACGGTKSPHAAVGAASTKPTISTTSTGAVTDAARATLAANAQVKMTIAMKDPSEGEIPPIAVTGSYDMAKDAGKLDVAIGPQTMSEIFTKDTLYAKSAVIKGVPADKWLAVNRSGLKSHYLLRTPGNDPAAFVSQIADLTEVQSLGSDPIGQETMKRYRGKFATDTLTRYLAPDKVADTTTLINVANPIFADIWVDSSGRIVRIVVSYTADTLTSNTELDLTYSANEPSPAIPNAADILTGTLSGGALVG